MAVCIFSAERGGEDPLHTFTVTTTKNCEFVDITAKIFAAIKQSGVVEGICTVFVPHTTAAVTINENADPDVLHDMLLGLSFVRDNPAFRHAEGNSVAHIRSSLFGVSETILISNSRAVLGTWQGVYFCEFDGPRNRNVHVSIIGK